MSIRVQKPLSPEATADLLRVLADKVEAGEASLVYGFTLVQDLVETTVLGSPWAAYGTQGVRLELDPIAVDDEVTRWVAEELLKE